MIPGTRLHHRPDYSRPPGINQIRLKCPDGDRASLLVQSSITASERMEAKTDESIDFDDTALIVIKSRGQPHTIELSGFTSRHDTVRYLVVQPSRQPARTLYIGQDGLKIRLEADESCTLRTSAWTPPRGTGPGGAAVL